MPTKPECRRAGRIRHEYIITLWEDLRLPANYAVSQNLSGTGMHFKSLFEMAPGARIWILVDDSASRRNQVPAGVVWCRELEHSNAFRYGVGVEFLTALADPHLAASGPIAARIETAGGKDGGVPLQMSKRVHHDPIP
jgi:hypothetical protein